MQYAKVSSYPKLSGLVESVVTRVVVNTQEIAFKIGLIRRVCGNLFGKSLRGRVKCVGTVDRDSQAPSCLLRLDGAI